MRRVIVVDGTFLKNKYKGVLLVATVVDDRNASISKAIGTVYPQSAHGICIHHLLTNVVAFFKTKGLTALVEKVSRAYRYDIRTTNPAESINSVLRIPREYPVIPLLDSIRELLTRWFYECCLLSSKHLDPLIAKVERKIDRKIVKAKGFQVYKVDNFRSLVKGDIYDCHVDLEKRTCTCGKYDIGKIPCQHVISAIYSRGIEVHRFTDSLYTTTAWRTAYAECINLIAVVEYEWNVPADVKLAKVLPHKTRKSVGRPIKRSYESVEDKIKIFSRIKKE
ncbi:uncharacterized protein LOC111199927 [Brassica napus]|uniref:uncharacterized protein LOC111199927 n=1 Tax=Brassica napus TaxID=3708 RepID=UPI0020786C88|nr:uncharacterized protein LOC111199927 [Brassica napus]